MDARDTRFAPQVYSARVRIADRDLPVYTYRNGGKVEEWTVAKSALGKGGSRWLPVRRPDLYAGDVFQTLARAQGVPLPAPEVVQRLPGGNVLAQHGSSELRNILRGMMKYSTNMTAEAVGMAASSRQGVSSHVASGRAMADWVRARAGITSARFADHSGLAGASRISAADMVRVLVKLGPGGQLAGLMKEIRYKDDAGRPFDRGSGAGQDRHAELRPRRWRVMSRPGAASWPSRSSLAISPGATRCPTARRSGPRAAGPGRAGRGRCSSN